MFSLASGCYSSYKDGRAETRYLPLLKDMIKDNSVAIANVDPQYKEVTIKILGVPVKHYEVNYTYQVNGSGPYSGIRALSTQPTSAEMPLYYAKSDYSYSSFEPEEDIKRITAAASSRSRLYWSIGWLVIAVASTYGYVSEAMAYLKAKKAIKDAEEEAYRRATTY
ncbi:hypothetical protein F0L74_09025 [Chitinophaga agrisoli]|uniref:Uncharacterized protein n=1 Tax=Chitinophaga agrisoli TaxID=2607653 RepID=A0A5B2VSB7_9BACT|nr:hypothetical protein [Chitinophaga agrisoli]KAA2242663.1 hypothetical protein F0L74_09025 [Chitinophaga agrisoli]